jgi:hypothetical protein
VPEITQTSYTRLAALAPVMRLVDPEAIAGAARTAGLGESGTRRIDLPTGKSFLRRAGLHGERFHALPGHCVKP